MCRHIGYLGEPVSPAEVVFRAPHSLLVQSYAPADMRGGGSVNADGFGLGWYPVRARRHCATAVLFHCGRTRRCRRWRRR